MNADKEYELMKRQVEAHEGIREELKRIADALESVAKATVVDFSDGTVYMRVAQV